MFGKSSTSDALNHSLADCEKAITHMRVQKPAEPPEAKTGGGWKSLFGSGK
jgi:hypothetical protein